MKVSLLTYSTRPRGGVVHTLHLAEALAALGVSVRVHALARGGDDAFYRRIDSSVEALVHPFPEVEGESVGDRVTRSIEALASSVDISGDEIVHAQDCISANAVADCIRTVHHIDHFTTPQLVECHARAITRPRAHICVSHAVAAELRTDWRIDATVIPNGVDAQRFALAAVDEPPAAAAREAWRSRIGGPFVLAVGGIEPRKGTIDLVDAMARLQGTKRDVRLVIAGGETLFDYRNYRRAFDERCSALGVEPIVLGPVAHDDLPALVAACDVFAFPSTYEGFGLAPMEALAAGRPVICRDLPVLREVFSGAAAFGDAADSFADEIERVLDGGVDPLRQHAGTTLAGRHRWPEVARRHVEFYERHLSRRIP
ncbi:MAG: MSMEG_0565 family glycosyltransferase [Actinomycetota bacterium]